MHPLVLGSGKRLFDEGFPASTFAVVESRPLPSGTVLLVYRRSGAAGY